MGYAIPNKKQIISRPLTKDEKENGIEIQDYNNGKYYVRYEKGGDTINEIGILNNYYKPVEFYFPWDKKTVKELSKKNALRNKNKYFLKGIGVSTVGFYAPVFRYCEFDTFFNNYNIIFLKDELDTFYLLPILNSKAFKYILCNFFNHTVAKNQIDLLSVPIPLSYKSKKLKDLCLDIIEKLKTNINYNYVINEQLLIDNIVYELYGLNEEDIKEIEIWYYRRYTNLAINEGLYQNLINKYSSYFQKAENLLSKPFDYWKSNPIIELILKGENAEVEFKETLEYNIKSKTKDAGVLNSSLKSIAAFLNSEGGILLIGVSDNGEIKGLENDFAFCKNKNRDGFEQKLRSLFSSRFTPKPIGNINVKFDNFPEGDICIINIKSIDKSTVIHFDNEVYVRDGNVSRHLTGPDLTQWITKRTLNKD